MSHPVELQTLGLFCWLFVFCFAFLLLLFSELLPNRRDHVNWLKSHQGKKFLCGGKPLLQSAEPFGRRLETGGDKRGDTSERTRR